MKIDGVRYVWVVSDDGDAAPVFSATENPEQIESPGGFADTAGVVGGLFVWEVTDI
ncbi:hypothetical protein [Nocardia carnea]|uniref:hypothetical protein n=1 Tax=Nocardia carnea TaxID=37328 RepID=UPI0024575FC8|nr:hypothetical protein [Nocardia carnea]